MADYYQILCGVAVVLLALYYYFASTYDFWRSRGVRGPKPGFVAGNFLNLVLQRKSIADLLKDMYDDYKTEPFFGIFQRTEPILVINDFELCKDVLIRDFSLFVNRGFPVFPKVEPLGQHLFLMEAEMWRPMRAKLSPVFTSGKLREMYPLMLECSVNMNTYVENLTKTGEPVDIKEMAARFTTDVIGSCIFGINMNALSSEESKFRQMGKRLFAPNFLQHVRNATRQFLPTVYGLFGRLLQDKEVENFFISLFRDTVQYRKANNIVRPDFVNMMIELQDHPERIENIEMTDSLMASQEFVFFAAGFETSSSTISHALYELAQHHDIQDKLRQEIRECYEKYKGTLTYEAIKEMKYLDKVFKETLRKHPLVPMISRQAMQNYTFKGTELTIPKGTVVWIPAYPIQRDPTHYPDPEKFDPERFNEDLVATRHPMSYLPFGDGPRNCIGARFAYYQTKLGLISVLRNYKVDVCEKTTIPFEHDAVSFITTMRDIRLKITKV